MRVLSTEEKMPRQFEQKGIRERLLCASCETKLSKYETYASTAFDGKETETPLENVIIIKDVDYKQFKLFLLSVLWRASISTLEFFSQVNLGPHEDIIRDMILLENPGCAERYPVIPFALIEDEKIQCGVITQPSRTKLYGQIGYRFVFGGFMWVYLVSRCFAPEEVKSLLLMEDNTLCLVKADFRNCGLIKEFAKNLKRMGRL